MSSSAEAAPGVRAASIRYVIDRANVELRLPARRAALVGKLTEISGEIELSPSAMEDSRATLRADLLSLILSAEPTRDPRPSKRGKAAPADGVALSAENSNASFVARAFDWLEISAGRAASDREQNRYAELVVRALTRPSNEANSERETTRVTALAELTLHRFRVPISLELDVRWDAEDGSEPRGLTIRTRRAFVIQLAAHDILPRDARGSIQTRELGKDGREPYREVHITAELHAHPAPTQPVANP